jgi:asparagine synthase (glutamine-hydrolysing)
LAGHWRILAHEVRALAAADGSPAGQVLRRRVLLRLLPEPMQRQIQDLMLFIRGKPSPRRISDAVAFLRHDAVAGVTPRNHVMKPNDVTNRWERLTGPGLPRRTENWALTAARHGLAAAFPLLDRRVVAFALSLPGALFLRDGWPRRLYRDAMTGILPAEIRESRQKLMPHPELPVMVMTQRDEMLRRLPGMRAHPRVTGLFDLDALERRLRALPEPEDTLRRAASLSADPASLDALLLYRVIQRALYVQQHHGSGRASAASCVKRASTVKPRAAATPTTPMVPTVSQAWACMRGPTGAPASAMPKCRVDGMPRRHNMALAAMAWARQRAGQGTWRAARATAWPTRRALPWCRASGG